MACVKKNTNLTYLTLFLLIRLLELTGSIGLVVAVATRCSIFVLKQTQRVINLLDSDLLLRLRMIALCVKKIARRWGARFSVVSVPFREWMSPENSWKIALFNLKTPILVWRQT